MKAKSNQVVNSIDPTCSAVVNASAGTGKTWLLVARLTRLLLAGVEPAAITAITFTRKAAAEMQVRLMQRLATLATGDDKDLDSELAALGLAPAEATRQRARCLYQELLTGTLPPRITTFHAFCQQLLQRFPLEAQVPPGFELVERTANLEQEALARLYATASEPAGQALAASLTRLAEQGGGLHNLTATLLTFLRNRADWWAYTREQQAPAAWAGERLRLALGVDDTQQDPRSVCLRAHHAQLQEFFLLLNQHTDSRLRRHAEKWLLLATRPEVDDDERWPVLHTSLFKNDGEARGLQASKAMRKTLGDDRCLRLEQSAAELATAYTVAQLQWLALQNLRLHIDWYACGHALLGAYQTVKQEQRLLDFADLEWKACELLTRGEHAHWVQYKLDARIDHILVDEFQDTNPTQWRLLYPLLSEFAADASRQRSVFLVGDPKQSIYSFRRAEPRLFTTAADWLQHRLQATAYSHDLSRRSSGAIVQFINSVFGAAPLHVLLPAFRPHQTVHETLPGVVALLPLQQSTEDQAETGDGPRAPLLTPRRSKEESLHTGAAADIATRIHAMVATGVAVQHGDRQAALRYRDILLLVPTRKHVGFYEQALRRRGIPYSGANRGTLLDCQEVQDIIALLTVLTVPFDNVALATVLRSPVLGCSDEDLTVLAQWQHKETNWMDRLVQLAATDAPALQLAHRRLHRWQQLAGQLPVHDLLDRIFAETAIFAAYRRVLPAHLHQRIAANLERLLDLSLELDAGRYPSVAKFLDQLAQLRSHGKDAPDEGESAHSGDQVTLMTVHGAKGLEAPVVLLADACHAVKSLNAYECLVDWPPDSDRPRDFLLVPRKELRGAYLQKLLQQADHRSRQEHANLLYVALTRARQILLISGVAPKRNTQGGDWYSQISEALQQQNLLAQYSNDAQALHALPRLPAAPALAPPPSAEFPATAEPPADAAPESTPAPPAAADAESTRAALRGQVVHRMLELLAMGINEQTAMARTRCQFALADDDMETDDWWAEALRVYRESSLHWIFAPPASARGHNEVPVLYRDRHGDASSGIIDRLIIDTSDAVIIDYKTHRISSDQAMAGIAAQASAQLAGYRRAVQALYPQKKIRAYLLFTANATLYPIGNSE